VGRGGRYLMEEHSMVIAPSATVYECLPKAAASRSRMLVIVSADAAGRERLTHAAAEGAAIARMYPDATLLDGRNATIESFEREARDAGMIHFSGHAVTSEQLPEDTFLALSSNIGGNARLDVRQVGAMKLDRAPVVVLAACSTARGRVTAFEGTASVARAFLAAGARSVVATLWPLDDERAESFFVRLHLRMRRGESADDALRETQIESIHNSEPASMWAAVQVTGN
jgi:CHAT domain-containing protein